MGWEVLAGGLVMGAFTYETMKRFFRLEGWPLFLLTLIGAGVGVLIVLNAPATP